MLMVTGAGSVRQGERRGPTCRDTTGEQALGVQDDARDELACQVEDVVGRVRVRPERAQRARPVQVARHLFWHAPSHIRRGDSARHSCNATQGWKPPAGCSGAFRVGGMHA